MSSDPFHKNSGLNAHRHNLANNVSRSGVPSPVGGVGFLGSLVSFLIASIIGVFILALVLEITLEGAPQLLSDAIFIAIIVAATTYCTKVKPSLAIIPIGMGTGITIMFAASLAFSGFKNVDLTSLTGIAGGIAIFILGIRSLLKYQHDHEA